MERRHRFLRMLRKIGHKQPAFPALQVPPKPGCILKCDLGVLLEHTGVYIGNGQIVSLNRFGDIKIESYESFFPPGTNPQKSKILVACANDTDQVLFSKRIVHHAKKRINDTTEYNLLFNNCHRFTAGCITGNFQNEVVSFAQLEEVVLEHIHLLHPKEPWWVRALHFITRRKHRPIVKKFNWRALKTN